MLEKGVKPDSSDRQGNNALHLLVKNASEDLLLEILPLIVSKNPNLLNQINVESLSPFHLTVNRELKNTVIALLAYSPHIQICKSVLSTCTSPEIGQLVQDYVAVP